MKHFKLFYTLVGLIILFAISCSKTNNQIPAPTDFKGSWTINKILGNDSWGAPIYWKNADGNTKIKFTVDGKYLRQYSTDNYYTQIGTYNVLTDSTIIIKPDSINGTGFYPYTLFYKFEIGGYMTWGNFGTEALVKEKFKKD